jgi:hypothetical protein
VTFDFDKIIESKKRFSDKQAKLPIAEKLRILDDLRERTLILRASRIRESGDTSDSPGADI